MPRFSEEIIESVREANDIVDVISEYVVLKRRGGGYVGLCPFHNEKTPSFSVNREKQFFYCFGCGTGGTVFTFLEKYENLTFLEALEAMAERAGITLPRQELTAAQRIKADERERLLAINKEAGVFYYYMLRSEEGRRALKYFADRGLSKETMTHFGLGYAGARPGALYRHLKEKGYDDDILKKSGLVTLDERRGARDKFWNRAMFPIMDKRSRVIAFGGRVMGDAEPKYLNSPETPIFNKSHTLYGIHLATKSRRKQLIVCEGYMDVIALHQAGFDNAVAALGTSFTEGHAGILRRHTDSVYLSLDSDGAGRKAALRAIPILKHAGLSCRVINMSPYKDPDELIRAEGAEEYQKRIDSAENAFLFRVRMARDDFDLSDPQGKTDFERRVADMLLEFETRAERENYMDAVARTFELSPEGLNSMVRHQAMAPPGRGKPRQGQQRAQEPRVRGRRHDVRKHDSLSSSRKLFLSWMTEFPGLFSGVSAYIGPGDFPDEPDSPMGKVAAMVFDQLRESGTVTPARIINTFDNEKDQALAADIFAAKAAGIETIDDVKRAIPDILLRIRRASYEHRKEQLDPSDGEGYLKLLDEKKQLEELSNIHFFKE